MGRHSAPKVKRRLGRPIVALVGSVVVALGATTSSDASFRSPAVSGTASVVAATIPLPGVGPGQTNGTGQYIQTRLNTICSAPWVMQWQWRDHMVDWGPTAWNGWSAWSTATSAPGWTGWSTSDLTIANDPAEVEWQVRCTYASWTGPVTLAGPYGIVRTT